MKLLQSTRESPAKVVRAVRGKTAVLCMNYARSSLDPDVVKVQLKSNETRSLCGLSHHHHPLLLHLSTCKLNVTVPAFLLGVSLFLAFCPLSVQLEEGLRVTAVDGSGM